MNSEKSSLLVGTSRGIGNFGRSTDISQLHVQQNIISPLEAGLMVSIKSQSICYCLEHMLSIFSLVASDKDGFLQGRHLCVCE